MLEIVVVCLVLTGLLAYVNHRFVGLPITIGVMMAALLLSLALVGMDVAGIDFIASSRFPSSSRERPSGVSFEGR